MSSGPVPAFEPSCERFAENVALSRARYVKGTPEKYPHAQAVVLILDAEEVLAELERLRAALQRRVDSDDELEDHACDCQWCAEDRELLKSRSEEGE